MFYAQLINNCFILGINYKTPFWLPKVQFKIIHLFQCKYCVDFGISCINFNRLFRLNASVHIQFAHTKRFNSLSLITMQAKIICRQYLIENAINFFFIWFVDNYGYLMTPFDIYYIFAVIKAHNKLTNNPKMLYRTKN